MRVSISTSEGWITAQLKLPRALVLSAALTIAGAAVEAIRCEMNIRELKSELARCEKGIPAPKQQAGAQ